MKIVGLKSIALLVGFALLATAVLATGPLPMSTIVKPYGVSTFLASKYGLCILRNNPIEPLAADTLPGIDDFKDTVSLYR